MLLITVLGLACAQVFWQVYGYSADKKNTLLIVNPAFVSASNLSKKSDYAADIGIAHLFGQVLTNEKLGPVATSQMPESLLEVSIKGILTLPDTLQSVAIFSVKKAADKVFKVGSELISGYTVHQISANGVVVDHNGKLEIIRLPRVSMADLTVSNGTVNTSSSLSLGQLRSEVLSNPLALEQHFTFVPYSTNGVFTGYRVNPGSKPAMFQKLGLHMNDIVKSIDGVGVGQLAGRMDILTNLSIANNLTLGIIRNGVEQQLLVDFSQ
jgi:general secretion pathway protein C